MTKFFFIIRVGRMNILNWKPEVYILGLFRTGEQYFKVHCFFLHTTPVFHVALLSLCAKFHHNAMIFRGHHTYSLNYFPSYFQVMATSIRSSTKCWLFGKSVDFLWCAHLLSNWDVLASYLFHYVIEKKYYLGKPELGIWQDPHQMGEGQDPDKSVDAWIRKLWEIYDEYQALKNIGLMGESQIVPSSRCFLMTSWISSLLP